MKLNVLFNYMLVFSIDENKDGKTESRKAFTTVMASTKKEAIVAFSDMVKSEKVWKPFNIKVVSCKLAAGDVK